MNKISIIVPCFNEEEVLHIFYDKITEVSRGIEAEFEYIFVDDGSKDRTLEILKDIEEDMKKGNDVKYFKPKGAEIHEAKSHAKTRHHHNSKDNPKYVIQFSPADELLKFADLLERGYISREEFDRKKVFY